MIKIDKFKNQEYAYNEHTEFLVQIRKVNGGVYKTIFNCYGNLTRAAKKYVDIYPIAEHKKRIVMVGNLGETVIDVEIF